MLLLIIIIIIALAAMMEAYSQTLDVITVVGAQLYQLYPVVILTVALKIRENNPTFSL